MTAESPDLRRHIRRELAERIVARAKSLDAGDYALIRGVYEDGRTAVELAPLLGVPPRRLRRRIRRLVQRLLSPTFVFVSARLSTWAPTRRAVARSCVIEGRSARAAARALGLSYHRVRRHLDAIHALAEAAAS